MKHLIILLCCLTVAQFAHAQDKKKYKQYKKQGDAYFESGEFLKASDAYAVALKNKRGDDYVKTKLEQSKQRAQMLYENAFEQAEKLFGSGQRAEAKPKYQEALRWKPNDGYISVQIENCDIPVGATFMKNFGGRSYDEARSVVATADGGFMVAGRATGTSSSNTDMSVMRLDRDGNRKWEKSFGADETEEANDIIATEDGNFLVVGHSDSYGGGPGLKDMWAVKIDPEGNTIWKQQFGSNTTIDEAKAATQAHGGGYILVGSSFEETSLNLLVVKVSESGEMQWKKSFGGDASEEGNAIVKTDDGYTIIGNTESKGAGKWDIWMLHIDKEGNKKWDATFGGGDNETGNAVALTSDGGYLLAGSTYSFAQASQDLWVVRTDAQGKELWNKNFGGVAAEEAFGLVNTADGQFVAAGFKEIWNESEKKVGEDAHDIFLVKFSEKGDVVWERSFGGASEQRCFDLTVLEDGGFIGVGLIHTENTGGTDMMVLKATDSGLVVVH